MYWKKGCWRRCYYLEGHLSPCPAQPTYGYADRPLRSTESNPFLWGLFDHAKTNWLLLPSSFFIKLFIHNPSRCGLVCPTYRLNPYLGFVPAALVWWKLLTLQCTGAFLLLKAKRISRICQDHNNLMLVSESNDGNTEGKWFGRIQTKMNNCKSLPFFYFLFSWHSNA